MKPTNTTNLCAHLQMILGSSARVDVTASFCETGMLQFRITQGNCPIYAIKEEELAEYAAIDYERSFGDDASGKAAFRNAVVRRADYFNMNEEHYDFWGTETSYYLSDVIELCLDTINDCVSAGFEYSDQDDDNSFSDEEETKQPQKTPAGKMTYAPR